MKHRRLLFVVVASCGDRVPNPHAYEAKYCQQPIKVEAVAESVPLVPSQNALKQPCILSVDILKPEQDVLQEFKARSSRAQNRGANDQPPIDRAIHDEKTQTTS